MQSEFIPGEGVKVDIDGNKILRWNLNTMVTFEKAAKQLLIKEKVIPEGTDIGFGEIIDKYIYRLDILQLALTTLLEAYKPGIDANTAIAMGKLSTTDYIQAVVGAAVMATNPYQFQAWILQQKMKEDQVKDAIKNMKSLTEKKPDQNIGIGLSTEELPKSDSSLGNSGDLPQTN